MLRRTYPQGSTLLRALVALAGCRPERDGVPVAQPGAEPRATAAAGADGGLVGCGYTL